MPTALTKALASERALWTAQWRDVRVCFAGISAGSSRSSAPPFEVPRPLARLEQCHSAELLEAAPGCAGRGDALYTRRRNLALQIVTADCVPILVATDRTLLAIHAGWRGLAGQIISSATSILETMSNAVAWIGPAIGPCCYEVGSDVAAAVSGSADLGPTEKVSLDLTLVARSQLTAAGLPEIHALQGVCTACAVNELWSYRRDGEAAGRNIAAIWRVES